MNARTDTHRVTLLHCTAQMCDQGRKPCPCPVACEVAQEDAEWERRSTQAVAIWVCVLLVVAGFFAGYVWGVLP